MNLLNILVGKKILYIIPYMLIYYTIYCKQFIIFPIIGFSGTNGVKF